jgi:membrane protease YdiL (CAAX protease family)
MEVAPAAPAPADRAAILRECVAMFAFATLVVAILWQLSGPVRIIRDYLPALVAVVFLYLPAWLAWRRGQELGHFGLTAKPLGRSLAFGLGGPLVVFPFFLVGFVLFYATVCAPGAGALRQIAPPGLCLRFLGWAGLHHPRLPAGVLETTFAQVVVVALPEELFFRGYLLARLEEAFPPARRVLGGGVGAALVLSALFFALGHVLVDFDVRRLAVFFPGLLFGWMRSATGSILAGVLCHASANLYIDALHRTFFG